jgi:alpha-galactosidase
MPLNYKLLFILCLVVICSSEMQAQLSQCKAVLKNDTLTVENNKIKRTFLWNNGALQSTGIYNKVSGRLITGNTTTGKADVFLPGVNVKPSNGSFRFYNVAANNASYEHVAAEVIVTTGTVTIKRIFRIYPDCPAIVYDYYVKGTAGDWVSYASELENLKNIEDENTKKASEGKFLFSERLPITGTHWQVKAVEFYDASDYNNNMVQEYPRLMYARENKLRGNLLFARNQLTNAGFFILKEAPVSNIQLQYQGFDFTSVRDEIKVAGLGIGPKDINENEWVRGYSVVVGIDEGAGEIGLLKSLRTYQGKQRVYKEERDAMILSNTWGDRNRDSRINEKFILTELDAAANLGVTHYQIDDGWQTGVSSNSAFGGSLTNIWRNTNYWEINKTKFPDGLEPVIAKAKSLGIQITLWFNPSTDSSFKNWEKDADVLIAQHKKYGLTMWKIDGVQIPDKQADINFRKFLDKVTEATNYNAVFNLDVTAGRRFGYNYMHTYGNLFLENRYTDWTNYYPHFTLRNLWQLSKYIPAQRLQIEFLNKWRNTDKYPKGDILAPANYSFDYLFAVTMAAQPLAWFEATGLPTEAFTTSTLISKYKTISADLHAGKIFPIGEEPSGFNWTGFQSMKEKDGYFIVFRENNSEPKKLLNTWLAAGTKVQLTPLIGNIKPYTAIVDKEGRLPFSLPNPKSFSLLKYTIQ